MIKYYIYIINPFTAATCTDAPANSIFSGPITNIFNAVRFDEDPFTCRCEKEDKKAEGFLNFALLWVVFK